MVLQAIRERLSGIIAIIIFSILIIPFVFVGVDSYFTGSAINSVARVNDVDITTTEFTEGFQNYRRRMQAILGSNFDPDQFDQPVIRRQYLDSLIDQQLLRQVSEESGLAVDDARLAQAIRDIPAFQVDGEFNPDIYQSRLRAQGTSPQQFENDMRAQLIMDQFPGTIGASAIATDRELKEFARLQDQQRNFTAIMVPASAAGENTGNVASEPAAESEAAEDAGVPAESTAEAEEPVDDASILAWYESHPDLYRSEEQVLLEYIELDASTLQEDVQLEGDALETQLRANFEEQKARFVTPESRLASHILIEVPEGADAATKESAREQAADLAERARKGEDFATLAKEYSKDAGSATVGGDLGWVEPGFMVQAFEEGLYALSLGSPISDPVETGFGWHIILLREIRPASGMTFDEAREVLENEYHAEVRERKYLEQADRLVDLIYEDPTTLSAASEELGLAIQEVGPFGRQGGDGIAANADVVSTAFSELVLQQGVVSDPIELGENHVVVIRVREHRPESLRPLDEVRDDVIASVRQDQAIKAAEARANDLLARLDAGEDIAALAAGESLELVQNAAARRAGSQGDTEVQSRPDLIAQVFLLAPPEATSARHAVVPVDGGYAVVRLEAVTDGVLPEDDLIRAQTYRRRISNAAANAETVGFLKMLRAQSTIEVFEDRL